MTRRTFGHLIAAAGVAVVGGRAWAATKGNAMRGYFDRILGDLRRFQRNQVSNTNTAASRLADRIAAGGRLLIFDQRGEYSAEALGRAGGLMAIEAVRDAGEASVHARDALVVVSDLAASEADLAVTRPAHERGALVVGICPVRPGRGNLSSACDTALDDCVTDEDACIALPGLAEPIAPTSGAINAAVLWTLTAAYVEALELRGRPPHIWMSIKRPGGREFDDRELEAAKREAEAAAALPAGPAPEGPTPSRLAGEYLGVLRHNVETVRQEEWPHLTAAADAIAQAIHQGHKVYQYTAGHMLPAETLPPRRGRPDLLIPVAPGEVSRLQLGDVLVTSNQYGVLAEYVQVAIDAKARGATLISMAPLSDPQKTIRSHPSGTSVPDHADILIQTHIPYGDASLPEPPGGPGGCPTSGTVQAVLYWALTCGVAERLSRH